MFESPLQTLCSFCLVSSNFLPWFVSWWKHTYLCLNWLLHNCGGREVTYISISSISPPPLPHRCGPALSGLYLFVSSYCEIKHTFLLLSINHFKDFSSTKKGLIRMRKVMPKKCEKNMQTWAGGNLQRCRNRTEKRQNGGDMSEWKGESRESRVSRGAARKGKMRAKTESFKT